LERRFLKIKLLLLLAAAACCDYPAGAVCPQPHPMVCAEFFKSDAVFVGTVVTEKQVESQGDVFDGWLYQLQVKQSFRGVAGDTVQVFTENSSGRLTLKVGETYLLFASAVNSRLTIDNCGSSTELSRAREAIHEIEQVLIDMKSASGGNIHGRVVLSPLGTGKGIAGVRMTIRGAAGTYSAVTDKDGWIHLKVPAGRYIVRPVSSKWVVEVFDLSYDDPQRIRIENGGCAELQFLAKPK
jgi:hypothetical protein